MYIPKYYEVTDKDEIRKFIQEHSFATIITTKHGKPIASNLPLELRTEKGEEFLTGHMAYANLQWRTFEESKDNVLVMFHGPDAYISSSWYENDNVPTWNYQTVHVYGHARMMTEEELQEDLKLLLKKYEQAREQPVLWENLSEWTKNKSRALLDLKSKFLTFKQHIN